MSRLGGGTCGPGRQSRAISSCPAQRRRWAKVGWLGVIAFHVLLVLFGVGFLLWALPALGVLTVLAVRDWPRLSPRSEP